jgi:hypothetical protein
LIRSGFFLTGCCLDAYVRLQPEIDLRPVGLDAQERRVLDPADLLHHYFVPLGPALLDLVVSRAVSLGDLLRLHVHSEPSGARSGQLLSRMPRRHLSCALTPGSTSARAALVAARATASSFQRALGSRCVLRGSAKTGMICVGLLRRVDTSAATTLGVIGRIQPARITATTHLKPNVRPCSE